MKEKIESNYKQLSINLFQLQKKIKNIDYLKKMLKIILGLN